MGFHGRLSHESRENGRFCKFCCDIAEAPFHEREKLIEIRNSVKEVENMIMFLQRMHGWQEVDRHAAFTSLEESRLNLSAKVEEYNGRRSLDVVRELNACFGNENNAPFSWDFSKRMKKKNEPKRRFFSNCMRKSLISWKWQRVVGIAVKLVMVSVSIKVIPLMISNQAGKSGGSLLITSKRPLDVCFGRG